MTELDSILQKVGRNVLAYQRLEMMLKFLVSRGKLEGKASELKAEHGRNSDRVSRKTLGNLIGELSALARVKKISDENAVELEEPWISFALQIDEAELQRRKDALAFIIEDRNRLIHADLAGLDESSRESMEKLHNLLDEQFEKLKPEYEEIRRLTNSLVEYRKYLVENWDQLFGHEGV